MIMEILKNGKPAEKNADKKPIRRVDPIIDKYREEGILGTRPGLVKGKKGEQLTIEQAEIAAKKESAELELEKKEMALKERRARELEIINEARNSIKEDQEGYKGHAKSFLRFNFILGVMGPSLAGAAYYFSDVVILIPLGIIGVIMTLVAGSAAFRVIFDMGDMNDDDESGTRWCIEHFSGWKAGLKILDAYEKGEKISEKDLIKALSFNYKLNQSIARLAEETGTDEAKKLRERVENILGKKIEAIKEE